MKNTIRFFLTAYLVLISFPSNAFWIVGGGRHQIITKAAAKNYFYRPATEAYKQIYPFHCEPECGFSDKVIDRLQASNRAIDGGLNPLNPKKTTAIDDNGNFVTLLTKDSAKFHCDNEKIQQCSEIIVNGRKYIVRTIIEVAELFKAVETGELTSNDAQKPILRALTVLGNITHTLQDFYSHSNWIEKQVFKTKETIVTPYAYTGSKDTEKTVGTYDDLITEDFKYQERKKHSTCETTPDETTLYTSPLTTGYYEERPNIYGIGLSSPIVYSANDTDGYKARFLDLNAPYYIGWRYTKDLDEFLTYQYLGNKPETVVEKCQHGDAFNNSAVGTNEHFGIAKDSKNRRHHHTAKSAAISATTKLIEAIISDVKNQAGSTQYVDAAIISFLQYPDIIELDPPTHVVATEKDGEVVLTWDAPIQTVLNPLVSPVYNLYYSTTPNVLKTTATKISNINNPPYTLTGLTNGVTYYISLTTNYIFPKSLLHFESILTPEISVTPQAKFQAIDDFYSVEPYVPTTLNILDNDVLAGHVYDLSTLRIFSGDLNTTVNTNNGTLEHNSNRDSKLLYTIQDTNGEYTSATVTIDVENNEEEYDDHENSDPFEGIPGLTDEEMAEGKKIEQFQISNSSSKGDSDVNENSLYYAHRFPIQIGTPNHEHFDNLQYRDFNPQGGKRILTRVQIDGHSDVDIEETLINDHDYTSKHGEVYSFNHRYINYSFSGRSPAGYINYTQIKQEGDIIWSGGKVHTLTLKSGNFRDTESSERDYEIQIHQDNQPNTITAYSVIRARPHYPYNIIIPNYRGNKVTRYPERDQWTLNSNLTDHFRISYIYADNKTPVAVDDIYNLGYEESPKEFRLIQNDFDPDNYSEIDRESIIIESTPTNGEAYILGESIIYTPNPGFNGVDTFTYSIADNYGLRSNTATVKINVDNQIIEGDGDDNHLAPVADSNPIHVIYYYGHAGNDRIQGSRTRHDVIDGGPGDDILSGGGSHFDTFVFQKDPGSTDTILDFLPNSSSGKNVIDLSDDSFSNLTFSDLIVYQETGGTTINLGDEQTIHLRNHNISDLEEDDFIFNQ